MTEPEALARALQIYRDWPGGQHALLGLIAAELRKESERAEAAQGTADSWQAALEEAEELLGARTNCSIGTGLPQAIKELKAKAAALELALREVLESAVPHPEWHPTMYPAWRSAEAVLRDHSGALAEKETQCTKERRRGESRSDSIRY